jgi:cysteine-S-conjugate beta-lyase
MSKKGKFSKPDTVLTIAGRDPDNNFGIVNPPVYHASTILFPTVEKLNHRVPFEGVTYGRNGTPTQFALEEAFAELEGAHRCVAVQSGLAAVTGGVTGFLQAGDHMLVTDSAYGPTRKYANTILQRFGVETTYYDPLIGAGIAGLMRPNTKVVFVESPGSQTFEVQDIPAIAEVAHKAGATVVMDNTWATPLFFRPFDKGVDVVVHAATKYVVGHSDAMLGLINCKDRATFETVKNTCMTLGFHAAPDDVYLGLRGLRSMGVRLRQHEKSGLDIARWLKSRPEVDKVLHPALPDCPGHASFKRDFKGSSGLFAFTLKGEWSDEAEARMLDGLGIFGMGYSWGGYESLMIPGHPGQFRTAVPWNDRTRIYRVHIGLEDVEDLRQDLADGLDRLKANA